MDIQYAVMLLSRPFQVNKSTHNSSAFAGFALNECFLMIFYLFDLNQPYWEDRAMEEVNTHTHTLSLAMQSLCSQVNALAAVSTSVLCLIGPFAVQSHLYRKPLLPLIAVPFAQAAG